LGETPGLSGVHLDLRAGGGGVDSMFKSFRVAVVIPCYRVEAAVADVVAKIPDFVDWIIAVNDASPDGTLATLKAIGDPRMVILSHEKNQGVGGAMATGYEEALRREADIVV